MVEPPDDGEVLVPALTTDLIKVLSTERDFSEATNLSVYEKEIIKEQYQQMKDNGQRQQMFELLRACGDPPTIEKIMNYLLDLDVHHFQFATKDRIYSNIMDSIKDDPELRSWVMKHFKQGPGYKVTKWFQTNLNSLCCAWNWTKRSVLSIVQGLSGVFFVMFDLWKDLVIFFTLRHFCDLILVMIITLLIKHWIDISF